MSAIPIATMSDDSGEWIVNRYQLQQPIGRGAMGTVYQALDTRLGRTVAVKFLAQTLQSVEMCDRFEVEAKATAQLSAKTQYVVSVSDYGVDQSNRTFCFWNILIPCCYGSRWFVPLGAVLSGFPITWI